MKIFLADLGHNQVTITSDVYPLGVTNLATYALANHRGPKPLEIKIFREPQDLKAALDSDPPDVLGVSSYAWNHALARQFARYAKAKRADTLTLMGGPNYPLTPEEELAFLTEMPEIDLACRGPTYEGERAFLHIIDRYAEVGQSLEGLLEAPVPGNVWVNRAEGKLVRGAELERIADLDDIPSPYLAGLMDPFFATGYFPMMHIARGCPFGCTFCNSSVASNNRINAHSIENIKADLDYIAERVRPEITLCFADDNFGMYPRDEEIADYLGQLQDRYGWPRYVRTTTGKNRSERIIRVMRKARNSFPMTAAVQSMNPTVLKNIKRDNIKLEAYGKIQEEVRSQGMQSYGELILGLPGETRETFMSAIRDLMESGVQRVSAHQLMLLPGAPLSNPDSRQRFGLQTRYRVVARCLGNYTGEMVAETEQFVVETDALSFQDYLDARVFHLLLTIFYYEGNFAEVFEHARQCGLKPFDLIVRMQARADEAPPGIRKILDDFVRENREELFDTEEACVEWVRENYAALVDGSMGGNLLSKYSMLGRFYVTQESLNFLEACTAEALSESGSDAPLEMLASVVDYLRCVLLHVPFAETVDQTPEWTSAYDVEAWQNDGYTQGLEAYRLPQPQTRRTFVEPGVKTLINSRVKTFGEHASGLGRFTRTMFARNLRRRLDGDASAPDAKMGASA